MGRLDGKTALVTGGGKGIGRAIAECFVAEGGRVVVAGRTEAPLREFAEQHPDSAAWLAADVARTGDSAKAVAFAVDKFGGLDILVNNAGVFEKKWLSDTTDEDIALILDVNVRGVLAFCRDATPHLEQRNGCIVNISSEAAYYTRPQLAAYGAAKAAVNHATRILALELGPKGIRVNAVAPGMTRTDMVAHLFEDEKALQYLVSNTALGRVGEPEEIAKVVVFLASDDAAWVTGQTISATGGLLL